MFSHHTKSKGDLAVLKVKLDLYEQGFMLLNPETEHAPFDLVIYKDGCYRSVQVKYRKLSKNGSLEVVFRSCYCNASGTVNVPVDKAKIDLYAIYCPDNNTCYYFNPDQFGKSVSLRVNAARNAQRKLIHQAAEFRKVP